MGNEDSKQATQNGDQDVTIIQTQEVHTGMLTDHDFKLTLILIAVGIQLIITIAKMIKRQFKLQATKAARAAAAIPPV